MKLLQVMLLTLLSTSCAYDRMNVCRSLCQNGVVSYSESDINCVCGLDKQVDNTLTIDTP